MAIINRTLLLFVAAIQFIATAVADVPFDAYILNANHAQNLTVAINVPSNSTDELYFHFQSPVGQQWAAFGFGQYMAGALMFVVYASTNNYNITISPRLATGHSTPQFTNTVQVTQLPGTQILDQNWIVNAKCTGCIKWNGGQVDVTSTAQDMIWAVGPSVDFFQSDDNNFAIQKHDPDAMASFKLNMQRATGEGGVPVMPVTTIDDTSNDEITAATMGRSFPIAVHAFLLIAAFLFVFPGGYLLLRLFDRVWIHAILQTFGLVLVLTGAILGIVLSRNRGISPKLNTPHQGLGLAVLALTLTAWIVGMVSHQLFKRNRVPGPLNKVHRGLGPLAILLGLANVGVGFSFSGNAKRAIPFYIAALIIFTLVGGFIFMINKRRMRNRALRTPAAQNFNEAFHPPTNAAAPPPPYNPGGDRTEHFPMQTFPLPAGQAVLVDRPGSKVQ